MIKIMNDKDNKDNECPKDNEVKPLSPDLKMHILLTVLHIVLMELVRRICLKIKRSYPW